MKKKKEKEKKETERKRKQDGVRGREIQKKI